LNTVTIHLPALRERAEDVEPLAAYFLAHQRQRYRKSIEGFEPPALDLLRTYAWPGNVRELSHVVERAVLMCQGSRIRAGDLGLQTGPTAAPPLEQMSLEEVEKFLIRKTLARFNGNAVQAAAALGLSRSALYRRLEKYQL
jgi:DNA-binding NtrC family response regulator